MTGRMQSTLSVSNGQFVRLPLATYEPTEKCSKCRGVLQPVKWHEASVGGPWGLPPMPEHLEIECTLCHFSVARLPLDAK